MTLFVVFEGIDGSGKTTQARSLVRHLKRLGATALLTHEPGGTPLGESLRRLLKRRNDISAFAELCLFNAARAQLVVNVIRPALASGTVVVSDRYIASTVAYQGHGRNLDLETIDRINSSSTGDLVPDMTVLLDISPEISLSRRGIPGVDAFEIAPLAFHNRVRESYLDQAKNNPGKWLVLDATQPLRELSQQIWAKVKPLL